MTYQRLEIEKYNDSANPEEALKLALYILDKWQKDHPGEEVHLNRDEQKYGVVKFKRKKLSHQ